jgi:VanZ family protein
LWTAVVLAMSSSALSAEKTGGVLTPLLAWLAPGLRPEHADLIHGLLRKTAHVTEYGILAVLWRRAFVRSGALGLAAGGWAALAVAVGCAAVDEGHQALLPSRTGTPADVLLDALGAAAAILIAQRGWWRVVDTATGALLWIGAVGGFGMLALDLGAGVGGGVLWFSAPAAAGLLVYRWRRSTSRS